VGAIVDYPFDEALMTCGLDAWQFGIGNLGQEFHVKEERLQQRLGVDHFRLPPDYREVQRGEPPPVNPLLTVPCVSFPRWRYCTRCGMMVEGGLYGEAGRCRGYQFADGLSCADIHMNRRRRLMPARFLAVCPLKGHIQDFPFKEWVHRDAPAQAACRLRLRAGRGASLSGVVIRCTCGQWRSMAGAFAEGVLTGIGVTCGGHRPWLGPPPGDAQCGQPLHVLQRGASNVYFPQVLSSIYLPVWAEQADRNVIELLELPGIWGTLTGHLVDGNINPVICGVVCDTHPGFGVTGEQLLSAAEARLQADAQVIAGANAEETPEPEEERYRREEYASLLAGRGTDRSDLYTEVRDVADYGAPVGSVFSAVTLVRKLRETRAFTGFTRMYPDDARPRRDRIADLKLNQAINWLPAVVVRGEGILFGIDAERIGEWVARADVQARVGPLVALYNDARMEREQEVRPVTAKFVLLHTLAHLLIGQLTYECGYGSSSLRERIYCDLYDGDEPMSGFLIYTAAGDSEGTMGGLVRQGMPGRLERTVAAALRRADWCSYDPVCMESAGQGPDSCNLAACHGCAVLPETSCEEGNRLLDRGIVVGTPDSRGIGLFGDLVEQLLSQA
jgi:hypothetical protein